MKRFTPLKQATLATALFLLGFSARADILPGSAMPEQVTKSLYNQQKEQEPAPSAPTLIDTEQTTVPNVGAEVQKLKFTLHEIILEGNSIYSTKELSQLYQSKIGKVITVAELFNIVQAITNYYRNHGYIISRAILPPQHVKNGIVRVQVIEGFLDTVEVTGKPRGAKCIVKAYGDQIQKCQPMSLERMEKYLTLANEVPGTQVKAVLSPSKKKQGAANLSLLTTNSLMGGYLSYDNYGTRYIGPQQMTANLALYSAINSGDSTQLTFTKTPKGGELGYLDLNYNAPINNEGVRYVLGGTRVHTHPLFTLQSSQIDGLNSNYYTSVLFPLIRSRTKSLNFVAAFNYLDSHVTTLDEQLYTDHLRNLDLGMIYNFADSWYGANLLTVNFRQGLPIAGYSSNTNIDTATTSRPGGRGDYTKAAFQFSRLQAVKGPYSLFGVLKGQWAFNPLLSSEQFTFGGNPLGRGYDVAELIGDRGLGGSLEARYDKDIERLWIRHLQFYVFYDAGEIWNILVTSSTPYKVSGTSTGIGVRFLVTKYVSGNLMWTQTLTKPVAAEALIGDGRRPRVFFSVVASWD